MGEQVNRRLGAAATAFVTMVAAGVSMASPAQAADAPITGIGIAEGTVVNGPVVLRPTFTAGADIKSIKIDATAVVGGFGDLSQGAPGAPAELEWDPQDFMDQDVRLSLIAIDSAGDWHETAPVTVYVDRWGPAYQLASLPEPGWGGWYVSVHQPIKLSAGDRAGVNRVELLQNGRLVQTVDLGNEVAGKVSLSLDPATGNGDLTLTIRLVDRFGNVTSNDFTAVVDNDPPTGVFRPSGSYLRGTFTSWPYSEHDNVYVRSMASYLDDHKGGGATDREPFGVRVNSRAVKDGRHTLTFELTDLAGNTGVARRTVYIDNTLPSIAVTKAPATNAKLTKKVTLKAKASDAYGVAKVQLLVDGKVVATDTQAGYQFTLNPKKYGKKFTVQMRAYDRAGNVRYSAKRTYHR
jgi:Bacterial Ig domain/Bacterial Ig-like domain